MYKILLETIEVGRASAVTYWRGQDRTDSNKFPSLILPLRSVRLHVIHVENPICERAIYRRTLGAIYPIQRNPMFVRNPRNVRNGSGRFNILLPTKFLIEGINLTLSVLFAHHSTDLT